MAEGGVIMRDKGFKMMVALYTIPSYTSDMTSLLLEQLLIAPDNQFGQYLEKWIVVIFHADIVHVIKVIEERLPELSDTNHRKRAEKSLKRLLRS